MNELDCIDLRELTSLERIGLAGCVSDSGDRVFLMLWLMEESGFTYQYCWFSKAVIRSGDIQLHRLIDNNKHSSTIIMH